MIDLDLKSNVHTAALPYASSFREIKWYFRVRDCVFSKSEAAAPSKDCNATAGAADYVQTGARKPRRRNNKGPFRADEGILQEGVLSDSQIRDLWGQFVRL
eukprot:jgi/Bigna1/146965/aug1.125_g21673